MKPAAFDLQRPQSIGEVLALLAEAPQAKLLAGGQSLVPLMNLRMVTPALVIDLNRVQSLAGITREGDRVRIGAMTRQRELLASPLVASHLPLMRLAALHVGHVQTRSRGTVGGSLAHADPSAELPLAMVTLDAEVHLQSAAGVRVEAAATFFRDALTTSLAADELLVAVTLPVAPAGARVAFREYARRKGDFAIAAAAVQLSTAGIVAGIGGVGVIPQRCGQLEAAAARGGDLAAAARADLAAIDAQSDLQASADYRRRLGLVALMDCLEDLR